MAELFNREDALAVVLSRAAALATESVEVGAAAGRVLAEDARAGVDLPPFDSSAMDGFAVHVVDTPGRLRIVGRIAAGRPAERELARGEAMEISTGGVVPLGADAVIPVEYVVQADNEVEIPESVAAGANVRPRGGDVRAGYVVVPRGTRLQPAHVGALAAAGSARVACGIRPSVAIVATGTELRRPGEPLGPGEVYEANGAMLAAAAATAGSEAETLAAVVDDEESHRIALDRALAADVVLTSGGVSVGPRDLVRGVLAGLGVEELFWGVAVKPGKPISFGARGSTLVFGLPGNPVSSLVGFELFVRPALLALQGATEPGPTYDSGVLAETVRRNAQRDELLRARRRLSGDGVRLEPVGGQESHMIVRAAGADALVLVPRGEGALRAGEQVRYLPLG
jgi:molybdopterin molybdotransferase